MLRATRQLDESNARRTRPARRGRLRRGQALIEFAVIAMVFYLLLAAIVTFGHILYAAQGLQQAADLAAREISRTPLPARMTLDNPADHAEPGALHDGKVRRYIFDEAYLVIDLDAFYAANPGSSFLDIGLNDMPLLNQQLATLMIVDRPDLNGDGTPDARLLRYPGALLTRTNPLQPPDGKTYPGWVSQHYTVGIPLVVSRVPGGAETIRWVPVVEEIDSEDDDDNAGDNPDPFRLASDETNNLLQRGVVALRLNYPYQAAAMSAFSPSPAGPFEPNAGAPIAADDGAVNEQNPASRPGDFTGASLNPGGRYAGAYGGQFGLGAQGALGSQASTGGLPVRPFRRVISAQAIYRREVFSAN